MASYIFVQQIKIYCTRTNFRGTYISQMPQIQQFYLQDFVLVDYVCTIMDLIFVDHMLSTKTAKFTSLENLYEYGILLRGT